jgi:hypothetical protein
MIQRMPLRISFLQFTDILVCVAACLYRPPSRVPAVQVRCVATLAVKYRFPHYIKVRICHGLAPALHKQPAGKNSLASSDSLRSLSADCYVRKVSVQATVFA